MQNRWCWLSDLQCFEICLHAQSLKQRKKEREKTDPLKLPLEFSCQGNPTGKRWYSSRSSKPSHEHCVSLWVCAFLLREIKRFGKCPVACHYVCSQVSFSSCLFGLDWFGDRSLIISNAYEWHGCTRQQCFQWGRGSQL